MDSSVIFVGYCFNRRFIADTLRHLDIYISVFRSAYNDLSKLVNKSLRYVHCNPDITQVITVIRMLWSC